MSGYAAVRNIYQIGDVRVHGFISNFVAMEHTATGRSEKIISASEYVLADTRHDMEQPTLRIQLQLYNDGFYTEGEYAQRLNALKGAIVDLIAYERVESQFDRPCPCSECLDCDCQCLLLWLTTHGRIVDVNVDSADFYGYTAEITVETLAYWEVMNRFLWYISGEGTLPITGYTWDTPLGEIYPYQDCTFLDIDGCWIFRKKRPVNKEIFFNSEWLSLTHRYGYEQYPETGFFRDFSFDNGIYNIDVDPRFAAPTKALYLFRFVNYTDSRNWNRSTQIRFENYHNAFDPFMGSMRVRWNVVNQIALQQGYTWQGDELFALGSIRDRFVVLRDFEPILTVSEALVYNSRWRGELWVGRNQLRVVNFAGMQALYFHTFRRY